MSDFQDWKKWIPKALAKYKMTRQARAALVCERFRSIAPDLLGKEVPAAVQPKFVKNHILTISVPSSLWAQKVIVKRHEILEKLNADVEGAQVDDIRTVVG